MTGERGDALDRHASAWILGVIGGALAGFVVFITGVLLLVQLGVGQSDRPGSDDDFGVIFYAFGAAAVVAIAVCAILLRRALRRVEPGSTSIP